MSEETTTIDGKQRQQDWLERLREEFLKLEPLFPFPHWVHDGDGPKWVQNVEREVGATMYPLAKLKDGNYMTPRRVGAILGHSCAAGVWLMECLEHDIEKAAAAQIETIEITPEQQEQAEKLLHGITEVWYPALRRFAKRALCSSVDQSYEDMTDFLLAYSQAFSRKPKRPGLADIGNPTIEIYFLMLSTWRIVNNLRSVHQLHQYLVAVFGPYRVGELKRVEKICQRIDLHYRKPGRPKKQIIQTPEN